MSDRKFFNAWVSKNFKGLSAHTLTQFLEKFCGFSKDYCMTIVYEKLFDYATKKDTTDNTTQLFDAVKDCVENCAWL